MIFIVRDRYENIRVMRRCVDFRLSRSNAQICTHLSTRRRPTQAHSDDVTGFEITTYAVSQWCRGWPCGIA